MIKKKKVKETYIITICSVIPDVQYISFLLSGIKVRIYYMIIRKQSNTHNYIYTYEVFQNNNDFLRVRNS